ncbi:MAG: Gfo/Idh/MocA family oxidoreductase [Mariprofundaceae bacterium]|nr:Gfo/Idh/MocA family oxidoreductase [Mariprofundaceae bacterium]
MQKSNRKKSRCNAPLRAVIVGCGWVAGGYDHADASSEIRTHAKAYALDDRVDLLAACDSDREVVQKFCQVWDVPHSFTDVREMLRSIEPDIVSICAPDEMHFELLEMCLDFPSIRGVWCEKPLATKSEGCSGLLDRYHEANVSLLVNYMRSYCGEYLRLKKRLLDGEFGTIKKAVASYTKGIMHNGSHAMHLLLDWLGEPERFHVSHAFVDHFPDDPTVDACLMFGAVPVYLIGLDERDFSHFTLTLFTERGQISLDEFGRKLNIRTVLDTPQASGHKVLGVAETYETGLATAMADVLSTLIAAVQNRGVKGDALSALKTLEITENLALMGKEVMDNG